MDVWNRAAVWCRRAQAPNQDVVRAPNQDAFRTPQFRGIPGMSILASRVVSGLVGGIIPAWTGSALGCPRRNWKALLGRRRPGAQC